WGRPSLGGRVAAREDWSGGGSLPLDTAALARPRLFGARAGDLEGRHGTAPLAEANALVAVALGHGAVDLAVVLGVVEVAGLRGGRRPQRRQPPRVEVRVIGAQAGSDAGRVHPTAVRRGLDAARLAEAVGQVDAEGRPVAGDKGELV